MLSSNKKKQLSLFVLLLVALIDYLGIGLVYPLFSYLMLNEDAGLLPIGTSQAVRGLSLGILISFYSISQLFSGPILGTLSDKIGRKKVLVYSLAACIFGYAASIVGIEMMSLPILLFSRLIIGAAAGSTAVVQAAIADVSTSENKSKHYALYSMFLGIGFTIGPFLGGVFANPSYFQGFSLPFWIGGALSVANLLLVVWFFQETHFNLSKLKTNFLEGLLQIKKVFAMKELHMLFLAAFIFIFGWSFYIEFIPLYLMGKFHFDVSQIGYFYAYSTGWCALSAGVLIMPLLKRFKLEKLFFYSLLGLGIIIFSFLLIPNAIYLTIYLPLQAFFYSLVFPTSTSIVSNTVNQESQGEVLGIFQSVQSMAWAAAPLFSGPLLCLHNCMPIFVGGASILLASLIFGIFLAKTIKSKEGLPCSEIN